MPGVTPGIAAHSEGVIRPTVGPVNLRYSPQYGLYAPVSVDQDSGQVLMPVHLLVASAWLSAPELSWFETTAYMHRLVIHKDGNLLNNAVGNLEWSDNPAGDGDPDFYEWLMREARWARRPLFVSPATSPKWRGE